jgi:proteic killer suppression protein
MITFRHRGLHRYYETGNPRYLKADQVARIRRILALLDAASRPQSLDLPGLRLHALKGKFNGFWAVNVSGNWRIIFRFIDGEARDVDLIDYH